MSNNSRQATRDAIKRREEYIENYVERLDMIFNNSVIVEDLPRDLPKRYLLKILRTKGGIAYDKQTKLFLPFNEVGIDVYGLPKSYTLVGFNGFVIHRKPREVVILRASDNKYCIEDYFYLQAEKLVDLDLAIEQNLEAVKTMTIVNVENESTLLSLANQTNAKRIGATVFYTNKNSLPQDKVFSSTNTGAEFLVDKLLQARKEIFNETLSAIGVNVANVDKKERVQGQEIRASQGYGIDSIRVLIDTFNHDAELGNLTIRLKGNTSLYEQYELDVEKQKFEMTKKGENKNETNG